MAIVKIILAGASYRPCTEGIFSDFLIAPKILKGEGCGLFPS